jgi:hypothetical protein
MTPARTSFILAHIETYRWTRIRMVEYVLWRQSPIRRCDLAPAIDKEFHIEMTEANLGALLDDLKTDGRARSIKYGVYAHTSPQVTESNAAPGLTASATPLEQPTPA